MSLIHDPRVHKLGKGPAISSPRRLSLAKYLPPPLILPPPPDEIDFTLGRTDWGQMLNDSLGDCIIAAPFHAIQVWTGNTLSDDLVRAYYEKWCGYDPSKPDSDQGGYETAVQDRWRQEGIEGHFLRGYADPPLNDLLMFKKAVEIFGVVNIGLALPISAQSQATWDVAAGWQGQKGSWGGHDVIVPKYNRVGPVCVTWGALKQMTWSFLLAYCDEAHALLSPDFDSNLVDLAQFDRDLAYVSGAAIPPAPQTS